MEGASKDGAGNEVGASSEEREEGEVMCVSFLKESWRVCCWEYVSARGRLDPLSPLGSTPVYSRTDTSAAPERDQ